MLLLPKYLERQSQKFYLQKSGCCCHHRKSGQQKGVLGHKTTGFAGGGFLDNMWVLTVAIKTGRTPEKNSWVVIPPTYQQAVYSYF